MSLLKQRTICYLLTVNRELELRQLSSQWPKERQRIFTGEDD
jgi:hypothetical protein